MNNNIRGTNYLWKDHKFITEFLAWEKPVIDGVGAWALFAVFTAYAHGSFIKRVRAI